jgi:ankyrin repeat protein
MADGSTALHLAARANRQTCVAALLEAGADASARDDAGRTPADVAATPALREVLHREARVQAGALVLSACAQHESPLATLFASSRFYDRRVWRGVLRFAADA